MLLFVDSEATSINNLLLILWAFKPIKMKIRKIIAKYVARMNLTYDNQIIENNL